MSTVMASQRKLPSQVLAVGREGTTVDIDLDSGDSFTVWKMEDAGRQYLVLEVSARKDGNEETETRARDSSRRVFFDRVALEHENVSHVHLTMRVSFTPAAQ